MGKELTFTEMVAILTQRVETDKDQMRQLTAKHLIGFIEEEFVKPTESSHTSALAQDSRRIYVIEERTRQAFWEMTGIDSRNANLTPEN